jgi:hypothetical protein
MRNHLRFDRQLTGIIDLARPPNVEPDRLMPFKRRIAPKALDIFKTRVREQTCRTRGLGLAQSVLTPYFICWRGYFGF